MARHPREDAAGVDALRSAPADGEHAGEPARPGGGQLGGERDHAGCRQTRIGAGADERRPQRAINPDGAHRHPQQHCRSGRAFDRDLLLRLERPDGQPVRTGAAAGDAQRDRARPVERNRGHLAGRRLPGRVVHRQSHRRTGVATDRRARHRAARAALLLLIQRDVPGAALARELLRFAHGRAGDPAQRDTGAVRLQWTGLENGDAAKLLRDELPPLLQRSGAQYENLREEFRLPGERPGDGGGSGNLADLRGAERGRAEHRLSGQCRRRPIGRHPASLDHLHRDRAGLQRRPQSLRRPMAAARPGSGRRRLNDVDRHLAAGRHRRRRRPLPGAGRQRGRGGRDGDQPGRVLRAPTAGGIDQRAEDLDQSQLHLGTSRRGVSRPRQLHRGADGAWRAGERPAGRLRVWPAAAAGGDRWQRHRQCDIPAAAVARLVRGARRLRGSAGPAGFRDRVDLHHRAAEHHADAQRRQRALQRFDGGGRHPRRPVVADAAAVAGADGDVHRHPGRLLMGVAGGHG